MDNALFEQLLYEGESATLDFKRQQYPFAKATDEEKAELLKDILGFANAFRRTDAYILIGVEDVSGGRSNVVGIPAADHLNDHSLQQFVNNLTNRPVRFHYEAFGFGDKQVGIIRVEGQQRPIFLKRDYGNLKSNAVYVRRGSSTDRTKPAGPDEIALMGQSEAMQAPVLNLEFSDVHRDTSLGTQIEVNAEDCEMPPATSIPNYTGKKGRAHDWLGQLDTVDFPNRRFYRQFALYEYGKRLARPLRLVIENRGEVAARSVRVELIAAAGERAGVLQHSHLPRLPVRNGLDYGRLAGSAKKNSGPAPGEVSVDKNDERFLIAIEFGDLQPGRYVRSEVFYAFKHDSGNLSLNGCVYAANLPQPQKCALLISFTLKHTTLPLADLTALADDS
jgi:Putative DNA-binding domain